MFVYLYDAVGLCLRECMAFFAIFHWIWWEIVFAPSSGARVCFGSSSAYTYRCRLEWAACVLPSLRFECSTVVICLRRSNETLAIMRSLEAILFVEAEHLPPCISDPLAIPLCIYHSVTSNLFYVRRTGTIIFHSEDKTRKSETIVIIITASVTIEQ